MSAKKVDLLLVEIKKCSTVRFEGATTKNWLARASLARSKFQKSANVFKRERARPASRPASQRGRTGLTHSLTNVQLLTQQTHFYFFMDFPQPHKTQQTLFDAISSSAAACDDTNSKQYERPMYTQQLILRSQHSSRTKATKYLHRPYKHYHFDTVVT